MSKYHDNVQMFKKITRIENFPTHLQPFAIHTTDVCSRITFLRTETAHLGLEQVLG